MQINSSFMAGSIAAPGNLSQSNQGPQGPIPPGIGRLLSSEQSDQVNNALESLSETEREELRTQLSELKSTAESEGLSLQEVGESFLEILSELSGEEINTTFAANTDGGSNRPPPPPGIAESLNHEQANELAQILQNFTDEQNEELKSQLDTLRESVTPQTAKNELSNSFINIVEEITGQNLSDIYSNTIDVFA